MTSNQKSTVYIDIDDEITSIIDKLRTSENKIVALVLPKRATMLQSTVNMKLLKKAADKEKKHLVLITSEAGLLPLAGAVGLHVAKTLQTKPEIPDESAGTGGSNYDDLVVEEKDAAEFDHKNVADKPVGELAGLAAAEDEAEEKPAKKPVKPELTPIAIPGHETADADETIALTSDTETPEVSSTAHKPKRDKSLKIPNFNKFRMKLIIGGGVVVALIIAFIVANIILPKATITIATDTNSVNSNLSLTLDSTAKTVNASSLTLPAVIKTSQQTTTGQTATTGQQNNGTAATGSVTMTAKECTANPFVGPDPVAAGTGITVNGLTFTTQSGATFHGTGSSGGGCYTYAASGSIGIAAQAGGTNYNFPAGTTFAVDGRTDVTATGSTSGGTDNIVQVVAQADLDTAKGKITTPASGPIESTLETQLQQAGYEALPVTFSAGAPTFSNSANAGDQASSVTVTQTITYTIFGIHASDFKSLVDANMNSQINTSKQAIINDGVSKATFTLTNSSATTALVSALATGTAGPHLNLTSLKQQVAGKKPGDVKSIISGYPGVTNVTVHYSPFWVGSTPGKVSKITITLVKS